MTKLEIYRLALKAVEREMDYLSNTMKKAPKSRDYLITQWDEYAEKKKELVAAIDHLSVSNGESCENKNIPERGKEVEYVGRK